MRYDQRIVEYIEEFNSIANLQCLRGNTFQPRNNDVFDVA